MRELNAKIKRKKNHRKIFIDSKIIIYAWKVNDSKNQDQKHTHTNSIHWIDYAIKFSLLVLDPEWKWTKPKPKQKWNRKRAYIIKYNGPKQNRNWMWINNQNVTTTEKEWKAELNDSASWELVCEVYTICVDYRKFFIKFLLFWPEKAYFDLDDVCS